ncbi:SAR1 [Ecytonucleospora hepatopenaei]|uniref:Small COPII coat GTPase SAR1 n=1 Tax=Ecytonucleospora hepatopenaei TaxID=646526 RepID=A0A1W0E8U0_9MICR|nr:SAR1 [Ecytonucleospora hepatopenaei]
MLTNIKDKFLELLDKVFGNFVSHLFGKPANILFLGIDNCGKTTLVSKLKNNTNHVYLPTKHTVKEKVEIGNLTATIFDIGGHAAVRIAWKDYFYKVDGIVFIVDVEDYERFDEVREAYQVVTQLEQDAPILILMNKIDTLGEDSNTISGKYDLMEQLEYNTGIDRNRKNTKVVYLSVLNENTYDENGVLRGGFQWLGETINERQAKQKESQY